MDEKTYFSVFLSVAVLLTGAWYVSKTEDTIRELTAQAVVATSTVSATTSTTVVETKPSPQVVPVSTAPSKNTNSTQSFSAAEVASHNSAESCWSIVNAQVYDLTKWIPLHPGGEGKIKAMCGKDSTKSFEGKHGGQEKPEKILEGYKIGDLAG